MIYFLLILAPVVRAKYDCFTIEERNQSIDYLRSNTLTLVLIAVSAITIHLFTGGNIWELAFMALTTNWLVFDYLLNHYRGKPVLSYYGDFEDEINLSFIEEYVYKDASWRALLLAKVNLFIISILIYIQ